MTDGFIGKRTWLVKQNHEVMGYSYSEVTADSCEVDGRGNLVFLLEDEPRIVVAVYQSWIRAEAKENANGIS